MATKKKTGTRKAAGSALKKKTGRKSAAPRAKTPRTPSKDESRVLAVALANAALEHKAQNVQIIDVRGKVDYSDYVVLMSGRGERHVAALARNIQETLSSRGERCLSVEGLPQASWLLMDYADVIVHIFHEETRGYYDLEGLWMDAARVPTE